MGNGNFSACCRSSCSKYGGFDDLDLQSVILDQDADNTLGDALRDLRKAVQLFREGRCEEASAMLSIAEDSIACSPHSNTKERLQMIANRDPDIEDLKMARASQNRFSMLSGGKKSEGDFDSDGPASKAEQTLMDLEASVSKVRSLCRAAQIFDAHVAYIALKEEVSRALETAEALGDVAFKQIVIDLDRSLAADTMLAKLCAMQPHMRDGISFLTSPTSEKGVHFEMKDPTLGEHFRLVMDLRFAEGPERDKKGPSAQLIVRGDVRNMPAPLERVLAENCETDLVRKEWIKDCKKIQGRPGGAVRLYSSVVQTQLSPSLLPFSVEDVILRDFAVCPGEGILKERGPGVMVFERRVPEGAKEFEGMPLPPKTRGYIRVKGGISALYMTQSQRPDCTNILAVVTLHVPVPQAIVPLTLLKRFAADLILGSLRQQREHVYDKWDSLEFGDRISRHSDFYDVISGMPADLLEGK